MGIFEFIIDVTGVETISSIEETCAMVVEEVSLPLDFEIADADGVSPTGALEDSGSIFDVDDTDDVIFMEVRGDMDGNGIFFSANIDDVLSVEALGDTECKELCTELGTSLGVVAIDTGAAAEVPECTAEVPKTTAEVPESMVEVPGCGLVTEPLEVDDFVPLE